KPSTSSKPHCASTLTMPTPAITSVAPEPNSARLERGHLDEEISPRRTRRAQRKTKISPQSTQRGRAATKSRFLFLRPASGGLERLARGGLLMGIFHQFTLDDETLELGSGDTLVAYTDGLTDAVNRRDEDYGHTRLTDAVDSAPTAAEHVLAYIL